MELVRSVQDERESTESGDEQERGGKTHKDRNYTFERTASAVLSRLLLQVVTSTSEQLRSPAPSQAHLHQMTAASIPSLNVLQTPTANEGGGMFGSTSSLQVASSLFSSPESAPASTGASAETSAAAPAATSTAAMAPTAPSTAQPTKLE